MARTGLPHHLNYETPTRRGSSLEGAIPPVSRSGGCNNAAITPTLTDGRAFDRACGYSTCLCCSPSGSPFFFPLGFCPFKKAGCPFPPRPPAFASYFTCSLRSSVPPVDPPEPLLSRLAGNEMHRELSHKYSSGEDELHILTALLSHIISHGLCRVYIVLHLDYVRYLAFLWGQGSMQKYTVIVPEVITLAIRACSRGPI